MKSKTALSGFFISEFLLYMALSACAAVCIMRYIYGTALLIRHATLRTDRIASIHAALDAICNDLEQAPLNPHDWRTLDQSNLLWQGNDTRIGWSLKNGVLKRITQRLKDKQWKGKASHCALEDVRFFSCVPQYREDKIVACSVTLEAKSALNELYSVQRTVLLNRGKQ